MNTGFPAIFPNAPTNPGAKLNFNIQFTGDGVSNPCSYKNGQYCLANGQCNKDNGCTVRLLFLFHTVPHLHLPTLLAVFMNCVKYLLTLDKVLCL